MLNKPIPVDVLDAKPPAADGPVIGGRVRHARRVKGYQLRDLAEKVGCSESLLSKIENDKVLPSLQMLHKIATELDTSIGYLFADPSDHNRIVMRKGERQIIRTGTQGSHRSEGVQLEWLVPYPESGLLSGSIHIVAPGGSSEGLIEHKGEEMGYVLEGEFEITVGDETFRLNAGDSFFFPSTIPHGYCNPGTQITRILWVNTPPTF
jgi:transcriptional regulator with XRE-family HTH domain